MIINNLELKLYGLIPINTNELFELVSSWGRKNDLTRETGEEIEASEPAECYNLSNLDVSQIKDFRDIFCYSYYDGDLSKWNVSKANDMSYMFNNSDFNNDSLKDWNVSNVLNMQLIFYRSKFNCNISNWDVSNVKNFYRIFNDCHFDGDISSWKINNLADCQEFFVHNKNFINKYLNNFDKNEIEIDDIFKQSKNFLIWFEENRTTMKELNQGTKEEVLDFFSFDSNLNKDIK